MKQSALPLVSIVVPCWNAETFVGEALASAVGQTYPRIEVIAIDDGSQDGTLDIIKSFGERLRWETGPNRGACAARNRGLALATGDYVKFLDADDILARDCLERQVATVQSMKLTQSQILFGDHVPIDPAGAILPLPARYAQTEGAEATFEWMLTCSPMTSSPLYPINAMRSVAGFDVSVKRGQEYELNLRLLFAGYSFVYSPLNCYFRREHDGRRISNAGHEHAIMSMERLRWLAESLDSRFSGSIPDEVRRVMAQIIWSAGRLKVRQRGDPRPYWHFARKVAPDGRVPLTRKQQWACRLFGPTLTARLMDRWTEVLRARLET